MGWLVRRRAAAAAVVITRCTPSNRRCRAAQSQRRRRSGGGAQLRVIMPANANGFDIAAAFIIDPRVSICSAQPHHVLVHKVHIF